MAPTTPKKTKEEPASKGSLNFSLISDVIDQTTFEQILEMDDEDDRDFSHGIVFGFFDQAETTFENMETALESKNLGELSSLGHFLKGSSATLGLSKVKDACEKIQHYGAGKDESGTSDEPDEEVSLKNIKTTLEDVKRDYKEVEGYLRKFFGDSPAPSE
ncbi:hypothetical protein FE257_007077 [Aspergillus nanangensis]|uniref:HPt domain-containing protein n=1 Tax=Aspergillus nanangensis TaxID=2582783 RepID=A0AAD4CNJ7_ASPNN|nr:hypothetical protein FE257_007077 [Aspergillus nanangensis]